MKYTKNLFMCLLLACPVTGCGASTQADPAAGRPLRQAGVLRSEKNDTEISPTMLDEVYAKKADFVERMKRELALAQQELGRLSAEVDRTRGAAQAEAKNNLDGARKKWEETKKELERAESATESTWGDAKGSVKRTYRELQDSFDRTRQWLTQKTDSR